MSRDHRLEAFVPSKYLALVGGFRVRRPTLLPHPHRLDVQWEYCGIYKIPPRGKPPSIGEPARYFSPVFFSFINNIQLSEVMSGVAYLHEFGIVHGDLKGVSPMLMRLSSHSRVAQANVLVDNMGTAQVTDFGLMAIVDLSTVVLSRSAVSYGGTLCWMSPELLSPPAFGSSGYPTRGSDCYALGMVIYEVSSVHSSRYSLIYPSQVLTGLRPFHHISSLVAAVAVLRGERPERPVNAESLGFSDTLWELVQSCWSETGSTRPTARQLLDYLSPASRTWIPPPVYPAIVIDAFSITYSDSSSSLRTSPEIPVRDV